MSQTEITLLLDGAPVQHARREPYWYEGHVLDIIVDDFHFELGAASGDGYNCLIDTLRLKLNEVRGAKIPEGCVSRVRELLEDKHFNSSTHIVPGDFLDLSNHWEDVVNLLGDEDRVKQHGALSSDDFEIVCVDMAWVGNGERLPPGGESREKLFIARVNQNHFVPLRPVGPRRSSSPVLSAMQSASSTRA